MKEIKIGSQVIEKPLVLAPMVGLTHSALRTLVMELGGAGMLYTEMLSATRLPGDNEAISPFLIKSEMEKPLFYQLYLSKVQDIAPALRKLEKLDVQGIDLNLGCPAPKLRRQGAGVYLSSDRERLQEILTTLRAETDLPVSVKIRLGQELDRERFQSYCKMLEDTGVDLITVHARLNKEKFCRKPRWAWVKYAKDAVTVPVFANGGIFSVQDAEECLAASEADGLMIGRGGAVRPWIFADIWAKIANEERPLHPSKKEMYFRFYELLGRFPEKRRLGRLKQFTTLYAESFTFGHQLATAVQRSGSMEEAREKAETFFAKNSTEEAL